MPANNQTGVSLDKSGRSGPAGTLGGDENVVGGEGLIGRARPETTKILKQNPKRVNRGPRWSRQVTTSTTTFRSFGPKSRSQDEHCLHPMKSSLPPILQFDGCGGSRCGVSGILAEMGRTLKLNDSFSCPLYEVEMRSPNQAHLSLQSASKSRDQVPIRNKKIKYWVKQKSLVASATPIEQVMKNNLN